MNSLKSWIPSGTAGQLVFSPGIKVSATSEEGECWKSVTSDAKRKASAPLKRLQLLNRFTAPKFWRGSWVYCLHHWWRVMTRVLHLLEVSRSTNLSKEASSSLSVRACFMLEHEAGTADSLAGFSLVLLCHGLEWNKAVNCGNISFHSIALYGISLSSASYHWNNLVYSSKSALQKSLPGTTKHPHFKWEVFGQCNSDMLCFVQQGKSVGTCFVVQGFFAPKLRFLLFICFKGALWIGKRSYKCSTYFYSCLKCFQFSFNV